MITPCCCHSSIACYIAGLYHTFWRFIACYIRVLYHALGGYYMISSVIQHQPVSKKISFCVIISNNLKMF